MEYPYYTEPPSVYAWQSPQQKQPPQAYQPPPQNTSRPPLRQILPPPPKGNIFNAEIVPRQFTAARVDARYKLNPIKPIVNSGASVSIITDSLANKLKIKATEKTNLTYYAIDGEERGVLGIARQIPIMVEDARTLVDLQIVTSNNDNFLLGIDWIKQHQANLLFRSDELEILDSGRPVRVKMTTAPAHVVHVVEKPKAEVNMTWNVDRFLRDVGRSEENDIANHEVESPYVIEEWTNYDSSQGYNYDFLSERSWNEDLPEVESPKGTSSKWEEINFVHRGDKYDPPC